MPHSFVDLDPDLLARPADWEPAPPPPAFDKPAERPLFADHDRRVPEGAAPPPPPTTDQTGWPFYEGDSAPATEAPLRGRGRTLLIGLLVLILAVAMYVAFDLGKGKDETPTGPSAGASSTPTTSIPTGAPIRVVRAIDFDPEADPPTENPGETKFAIDGKPGPPGWRTMAYDGDPHLGGLKSGVGLVLDLGTDKSVGSLELDLTGAGTHYEVWATPAGVDEPPTELADLRRIGGQTAAGSPSVLRFTQPVRTRYLLVWLTSLPQISGGRYRAEIDEAIPRP